MKYKVFVGEYDLFKIVSADSKKEAQEKALNEFGYLELTYGKNSIRVKKEEE